LAAQALHPSRIASARPREISHSLRPIYRAQDQAIHGQDPLPGRKGSSTASSKSQASSHSSQRAAGAAAREATVTARCIVVAAPAQVAVVMQAAAGVVNQ